LEFKEKKNLIFFIDFFNFEKKLQENAKKNIYSILTND